MRKTSFLAVFQRKIKPLSRTGGNKIYSQFGFPCSPHSCHVDENSTPTLIKPAQQVKLTVFTEAKVLCEKRNLYRLFKEKLNHFPTLGAKNS